MMRIIAHRGSCRAYPENSLAAFSHAKVSGADALEVDLRRSADGKVYCYHDSLLNRLTGFKGEFESTESAIIERLKLRSQEPVLSFESFLEAFGNRIEIVLDVKTTGIEREILSLISSIPGGFPIIISSFHSSVLREIKRVAPPARTALIVGPIRNLRPRLDLTDYILRHAEEVGCEALHLSRRVAGARRVLRLQREGYRVCVWTVDDEKAFHKYRDLGVAGIITNVPESLVRMAGVESAAGV